MIDNNLEHNKKSSKPKKLVQRLVKPKLILSLLLTTEHILRTCLAYLWSRTLGWSKKFLTKHLNSKAKKTRWSLDVEFTSIYTSLPLLQKLLFFLCPVSFLFSSLHGLWTLGSSGTPPLPASPLLPLSTTALGTGWTATSRRSSTQVWRVSFPISNQKDIGELPHVPYSSIEVVIELVGARWGREALHVPYL